MAQEQSSELSAVAAERDEEARLLDRLLADDPAAWRTLVASYTGLLLGVCRKTFAAYGFKAAGQDQEDVVAAVWKNTLENNRRVLRQCRARGNLPQTLCLLSRRRTIDWIRAHRNRFLPLMENDLPPETAEAPYRPADLPALPAAFRALNSKERTLLQLFFFQKKKYREIAVLTGIPQNSIGPTLGRALAKLRDLLRAARAIS